MSRLIFFACAAWAWLLVIVVPTLLIGTLVHDLYGNKYLTTTVYVVTPVTIAWWLYLSLRRIASIGEGVRGSEIRGSGDRHECGGGA